MRCTPLDSVTTRSVILRQQQAGQREVAEEVRAELHLEAVGRAPLGTAMTPALLISTSTGPVCSANARTEARSARSSARDA